MFDYFAHGLSISSQIELPAFDRVIHVGRPGVVVRIDTDATTEDGVVVAEASVSGLMLRIVRRVDGALSVRAGGVTMCIDGTASTLTVHTNGTSQANSAMPWLVGGLGIAVTLMMNDALVLHGSMFEFDDRGHLVMAPSGHGKSLVTAAACAVGARLVAEDTVRVDLGADAGWRAFPGSAVLRTRRAADELAAWFDPTQLSLSSDGRVLVRFDQMANAVPIDRLHLVALDGESTAATIDWVDDPSALMACLGHLRVPGIIDERLLDQHFDLVGALTSRVPLDLVRLPWSGDFGDLTEHVRRWLTPTRS